MEQNRLSIARTKVRSLVLVGVLGVAGVVGALLLVAKDPAGPKTRPIASSIFRCPPGEVASMALDRGDEPHGKTPIDAARFVAEEQTVNGNRLVSDPIVNYLPATQQGSVVAVGAFDSDQRLVFVARMAPVPGGWAINSVDFCSKGDGDE